MYGDGSGVPETIISILDGPIQAIRKLTFQGAELVDGGFINNSGLPREGSRGMKIPDELWWYLCDNAGAGQGGWIAPDGTFIESGFGRHEQTGEIIAAWLNPEVQPSSLTDLGWALINTGGMHESRMRLYLPKRGLNQTQRDKIFDVYPELYSKLIAKAESGHIAEEQTRHFFGYAKEHFEDIEKEPTP